MYDDANTLNPTTPMNAEVRIMAYIMAIVPCHFGRRKTEKSSVNASGALRRNLSSHICLFRPAAMQLTRDEGK